MTTERAADADADAPRPRPQPDPVKQTRVIVVGNVFIVAVVLILRGTGYDDRPPYPTLWLVLEGAVIAIGSLTAFSEIFADVWTSLTGADEEPRWMERWKKRRPTVQGWVVYGLSFLVIVALASLVWVTGLGIESPYVPLAAAPAVYGPFIAGRRGVVIGLVVVVSLILGAIVAWAPSDACGIHTCAPGSAADHRPHPEVFLVVTVTFMAIAGAISGERLSREQKLNSKIESLQARLKELGET